jgi:hypothetical protein
LEEETMGLAIRSEGAFRMKPNLPNGRKISRMHEDATPRVTEIIVELKVVRTLSCTLNVGELVVDGGRCHD